MKKKTQVLAAEDDLLFAATEFCPLVASFRTKKGVETILHKPRRGRVLL